MSKNINLEDLLNDIQAVINNHLGVTPSDEETKPTKKGKGKVQKATEPEPEVEDDDEDDADDEGSDLSERIAELKKQRITALRKLAKGLGFEEEEVAEADKDTLAEAIAEAEAEDAEGDDTEDDDDDADEEEAADEEDDEEDEEDEDEDGGDDEDEESDEYTRDDYLAMSLPDLKGLAKEAGYKAADLKGLDKDGIADLLLDEGDEDGEDDEDDVLTEEDLRDMSLAELKALCKDYDIKVPRGAKSEDLIELLMEDDEE